MLFLLEVVESERAGRARYWRPGSCGYTDEITAAGLYTEDEARKVVHGSDRTVMLPALPRLTVAYDALQAELARVQQAMRRAAPDGPPCSIEAPGAAPIIDDETLGLTVAAMLGRPLEGAARMVSVVTEQVRQAEGIERKHLWAWIGASLHPDRPHPDVDLTRRPWPLLNVDAALRAFDLAEREADEARRTDDALHDCPGDGKCHGTMRWCDICGHVDDTSNDPDCDVHHTADDDEIGYDWPHLDETVARVCADYGLGRNVTIHVTYDGPVRRVQFQSDTPGTHTFVQRNTPAGFTVDDVRTNGVALRRPFLAEGENAARALDALCRVKDLGALVGARTVDLIDEVAGEVVGARTFFTTDRGVEYEVVLRHAKHTVEVVAFQPTSRP